MCSFHIWPNNHTVCISFLKFYYLYWKQCRSRSTEASWSRSTLYIHTHHNIEITPLDRLEIKSWHGHCRKKTWLYWMRTSNAQTTGFPQALEIMETYENHTKKFYAWKSHEIWKKLNNHGISWNNLGKQPVAVNKLADTQNLCVWQLVSWLLVVSSFNYFKMHAWSTSMLI